MLTSINIHNYWFIEQYVILLLIAPLLEKILDRFDYITFSIVVFLCSVTTFYYLWLVFGTNGYNAYNFIYLYLLGRFIRLSIGKIKINILICLIVYITIAMLLAIIFIVIYGYDFCRISRGTMWFLGYNNPLIIMMSISIFLFFIKVKIQNRFINKIAATTLGIYVIHTLPSGNILELAPLIFSHNSYWGLVIFDILIFVVCALFTFIICRMKSLLHKIISNWFIHNNEII